ncbi:MAG: hypothetical protein HY703_05995 [Gemmatimonadetes bacterium]|nr:hypothetical protein [Gemmatimonadota bacterium]
MFITTANTLATVPPALQHRLEVLELPGYTAQEKFEMELAGRTDEVGTATALAYTPAGGQILFVEAVSIPGDGEIHLTGQLGAVMKESAQAALSYVRIAASQAGIRTVLLPRRNEVDLEDVPAEVKEKLELVLIDNIAEALRHALVERTLAEQARPAAISERRAA